MYHIYIYMFIRDCIYIYQSNRTNLDNGPDLLMLCVSEKDVTNVTHHHVLPVGHN